MIKSGGNPFLRNKEGASVNSLIDNLTEDQADVREQLKEAIKNFFEEQKRIGEEGGHRESAVHAAARNKNLKLLKRYKLLQASFDSYNYQGQKPVEVAHLEVAIFLMQHTHGFFQEEENNICESYLTTYSQDPKLREKCLAFLRGQPTDSMDALKVKYPRVFESYENAGSLEAGGIQAEMIPMMSSQNWFIVTKSYTPNAWK